MNEATKDASLRTAGGCLIMSCMGIIVVAGLLLLAALVYGVWKLVLTL